MTPDQQVAEAFVGMVAASRANAEAKMKVLGQHDAGRNFFHQPTREESLSWVDRLGAIWVDEIDDLIRKTGRLAETDVSPGRRRAWATKRELAQGMRADFVKRVRSHGERFQATLTADDAMASAHNDELNQALGAIDWE